MITVVTPFTRKENLPYLLKMLEGKVNWTVLIDDETLKDLFPSWVTVKLYEKPIPRENVCVSNVLFNRFISELDIRKPEVAETQYMILCDDDTVEEGFWEKIPNEDAVIVSMLRSDNPGNTLMASPDNIEIGKVGGEQLILKGKILRSFRYGLSPVGDGEMIKKVVAEYPITYVPDAYVVFNFLQDGRYKAFRRKPLVMFVGDYYCAGRPQMGISEWETNIWSSLESTGLADVIRFHFDKFYYHTGKRADSSLIERIEEHRPDLIVLIIYKPMGADPATPAQSTLEVIKMLGIPVITIWGDLEAPEQRNIAKTLEPYCRKLIGTATKEVVESLGYVYAHVPKDSRLFNNPHLQRDIDIVFSGSFGLGREERQATLIHLLDNGVKLVHGGSEGRDHFSTEEYAQRYKRAKLALSFSKAHGINVVNARPFEAMSCGAMLLEQDSPELAKLFTPGVDYVPWTTNDDLLQKVRYYLEHEDERALIASNGQNKIEELYSAKKFWSEALKI